MNSKVLFATNYFTLSIIYHVPGMIYCVLSEPCVYISCYYGNVQGVAGADEFLVQPTPYDTAGPVVGGWRGKEKPDFDDASLIVTRFKFYAVSPTPKQFSGI